MKAAPSIGQLVSLTLGGALLAVGVLAFIFGSTDFGTGSAITGETFVIWLANGWDAVIWAAFGAAGLLMAGRVRTARAYAVVAGTFFVVAGVWGFIDGTDALGLMAVDTTVNISHAVIGAIGLLTVMMQSPSEQPGPSQRHEPPGAYGHGHPSGV